MMPPIAIMAALTILLAAASVGCASAPPSAEPARPPNVPGLAPLPPPLAEPPPVPGRQPKSAADQDQIQPTPRRAETSANPAIRDNGCSARAGVRAVRRSALSSTLDAGLGNWLRGVDIEPKIDRGRFQGWLVRSIYTGDPCWADVDLRAGDVVNRVNGRPIERPEEAQVVWTALRGTREIVIDLLRAGKPRKLKFDVVDDPK